MKYIKCSAIIFILSSLIVPAAHWAWASPSSLGEVESVLSEGAIDARRNPALMAQGESSFSIALLGYFTPYTYDKSRFAAEWGSIAGESYRVGRRELSALRGDFALSGKSGESGWGLAFYNRGYANFSSTMSRYSANLSLTEVYQERAVQGNAYPTMTFSWGTKLGDGHSIGFRFSAGCDLDSKARYIQLYQNSGTATTTKTGTWLTDFMVTGDLGLGYSFRDDTSQVGLMIGTGRIVWDQMSYKYETTSPIFSPYNKRKGTYISPSLLRYESSVKLTAGGYKRLLSFLGIVMEGEFTFPATYRKFDLFYGSGTYYTVYKASCLREEDAAIVMRGGLAIYLSSFLVLNAGGSVGFEGYNEKSYLKDVKSTTDVYTGTAGIDLLMGKHSMLTLGAQVIQKSRKVKEVYSTLETFQSYGHVKSTDVFAFAGIILGF